MKNKKPILIFIGLVAIILLIILVWKTVFGPSNGENSATSTANNLISKVSYGCSAGKTIQAEFYKGEDKPAVDDQSPILGGSAKITLSDGRSLNLHQTISADGVRYANADESFVFWSKGNGALVLEKNAEKSYIGCVAMATPTTDQNISQSYVNNGMGFSILLPSIVASTSVGYLGMYKLDETHVYQPDPDKKIYGVKFTIPENMTKGTNLSSDSYISVESLNQTKNCAANLFTFSSSAKAQAITEGNTTYSVASTSDAAAGNRYEETIYALVGTNPCIAIRYFIHYGAIQNYPEGVVKEFDKQALLKEFDVIRKTLVVR